MKFQSLVSGSSGNSVLIEYKKTCILIDCGTSARKIEALLKKSGKTPLDIKGVVITHEHGDHTAGTGVFTKRTRIPVYSSKKTLSSLAGVDQSLFVPVKENEHFEIGDLTLKGFSIPHDAREPFGYNVFGGKKKLSVATDMGRLTAAVAEHLRGSLLVYMESNHDVDMLVKGPYPHYLKRRILGERGHLSNQQASKLAAALARTGTKHIILAHLSDVNNLPAIAYEETSKTLEEQGAVLGKDIYLSVANRYDCGSICAI